MEPCDASVSHIVDPDGGVVLFRVAGRASHRTVDLIDAVAGDLGPRSIVHLDLHDAVIPAGPVMRELERLADRLEHALVRVRMVGVDPNHPAI